MQSGGAWVSARPGVGCRSCQHGGRMSAPLPTRRHSHIPYFNNLAYDWHRIGPRTTSPVDHHLQHHQPQRRVGQPVGHYGQQHYFGGSNAYMPSAVARLRPYYINNAYSHH